MGRAIIRGWVLLTSELTEVIRQPMLVLALVLGPFLILLVFALGHRSQQPPLTMVLVVPPSVGLSRDLGPWRDRFGGSVTVIAMADNEAAAREAVVSNQADLALIIPATALTDVTGGKQVMIRVLNKQINPVDQAYTGFVTYILASELNKQIITEAARQAQADIGQARGPLAALRGDLANVPNLPGDRLARINSDLDQLDRLLAHLQTLAPGLLAAPVATSVENVAGTDPGYVAFYSPGVLALLLQHVAITLASLSIVRDRLIGVIELYKVAPTSTFFILFGKYMGYSLVCLGVGAALTFLLLRVIGVPFLGDPRLFGATAVLLVAASLGIGFTISLLSTSQENAVQLTMLVLLASVFFSGFFLPVTALQTPATEVSFVLPVRHAITAFQDLMLRGELRDQQPLLTLGAMSVLFLISSSFLLHRELRRT